MSSWLGQYELGQTLGQGSYSKVKLARDSKTNEMVAIKIHKAGDPKFAHEDQLEKTIEAEVNTILELDSHPHIIALKGYYPKGTVKKVNGKDYEVKCIVVEEQAAGGELFFFVKHSGPFAEPHARYLFRQIIDGLEHMHSKGIAHRDIKVDNVLLDADFNVKLADFGFAGPMAGRNGDGYMRTMCGTKPYEAPEIFEKAKYKGSEVDLFATAVVLFIMVSGTPPFTNAEKNEFYYKFIIQKQYDKFWGYHYQGKPGGENFFSAEFKDLINHMLNYNPTERFTIDQIKKHAWYTGPTPSYSELRSEFESRKQKNDLEQQKELQKKKTEKQRARFRGAGGDDSEEEKEAEAIELSKDIKEYVDNQLQTKIFYKDSPDLVFEILENYINKKQEDGEEFKFEVSDSAYKAKISAFDSEEKVKFDVTFKVLRVGKEDFFALEFFKNEGDSIQFLDFFKDVQNYLDVKLGYEEEKGEEEQ